MAHSPEEYADFRILARCPSGSKKNSTSYDSTNGIMRYRFTLGEVLSWNIDIDVIVGNGWTRITLKEIPRFLVDGLDFIMANGLHLDGIFRKEGNSARLNRPEVQEVYRGVRAIPSDFTVLDVCTMVKRFLKDLKPTLLNSENIRHKLIVMAKQARMDGEYTMTHEKMCHLFESSTRRFPPAHLGTLAYVMRFLSRISKHSDSHKMTVDNLALVLVGSVFGEYMVGGGTESRKKMQQVAKSWETEMSAKKEDMEIQVAAVKLLIVNANLIALPKSHYVSSNRLHSAFTSIRSTSAMPNIRCASVSETETHYGGPFSSGLPQVFNMAKASIQQRALTRRDSDLTHVKNLKPRGDAATTKRSSSFLPIASLRGLRDKVSNQFLKRNKSPSPDKGQKQAHHSIASTASPTSRTQPHCSSTVVVPRRRVSSGVNSSFRSDEESSALRSNMDRDRRGDGKLQKHGSTSSGRMSRAHTKKGNINSMARGSGSVNHRGGDSDSQKSFQMSPTGANSTRNSLTVKSSRSLRRSSQTDHNDPRKTPEDSTPPLEKKKKKDGVLVRRNTADGLRKSAREVKRRSTFWGVDTIAEDEKENQKRVEEEEIDEYDEESCLENGDAGESVLEMMNFQARLRRVGAAERRRRFADGSMVALNGSMATFDKMPSTSSPTEVKKPVGSEEENPKSPPGMVFSTPARGKPTKVLVGSSFNDNRQHSSCGLKSRHQLRLDAVATPMISRRGSAGKETHSPQAPSSAIPLRKLDSIRKNGSVWVGETLPLVSSPILSNHPSCAVEKVKGMERVSPILARSPVFRSPSVHTPIYHDPPRKSVNIVDQFTFRSKSHLTDQRLLNQDYLAYATPPRDRRPPPQSPQRAQSNLIYFTPTTRRHADSSACKPASRPIVRSTSSVLPPPELSVKKTAHTPQLPKRSSVDEAIFKCPLLPPMRVHASKERRKHRDSGKSRESSVETELGFGEYNELLKASTEETKFPHQPVEARPSVTMLRSSNCGLVQSRINHFQTIERSHRPSTDLSSSGRQSAVSQISLKSIETISSAGGAGCGK